MKNLFKSLLVIIGLLLTFGAQAQTTGTWTSGSTTAVLAANGTLTITGTGAMTNYPDENSVPWLSSRSAIKTAVISAGVTNIGNYAFYGCYSLTSVTIPNSVTSIGISAFEYCNVLTSAVTVPNSVTRIGDAAFRGCSDLTSVDIPNVTYIGASAFAKCTVLTDITIPAGVTNIGASAFSECLGLTSVTIPTGVTSIEGNTFYACLSLTSVTIPNSVKSIGTGAFSHCNSLSSVDIPESVTSIEGRAFYDCRVLTSMTIPDGVTGIGTEAFRDCRRLTTVTIPNSVASIGGSAFYNCDRLDSIHVQRATPPSLLGSDVFEFVNTTCTLHVPTGAKSSYQSAAQWSRFVNIKEHDIRVTGVTLDKREITLATGSKEPLDHTVQPAGATNRDVTWSSSHPNIATVDGGLVTAIMAGSATITATTVDGGYTEKCVVKVTGSWYIGNPTPEAVSATLSNDEKTLTITGKGDMQNFSSVSVPPWYSSRDAIKTVVIGGGVTGIGNEAFRNCRSLTAVTIPDGVTYIGANAFDYCAALTTITIPNSVERIRGYAFAYCTGLTSIHVASAVPAILDPFVFESVTKNTCKLHVPQGALAAYKAADDWKDFLNIIDEGGSTVTGVTGVTLNKPATTLAAGASEQLIATVEPADATNREVTWSSSDEKVASVVSTDGLVTAIAAGTAIIKVTTTDGGKTANCVVTVNAVYTVRFNSRGGSSVPAQTVVNGGALQRPTPPTRAGYTFAGWFHEIACQNEWLFNSDVVTSDTELFAKWTDATAIEAADTDKLTIYPNPAKNELFIQSEQPLKKVEIYNQSGQLVLKEAHAAEKIDVSRLESGIYLVRVSCSDGLVVVKKIIVR